MHVYFICDRQSNIIDKTKSLLRMHVCISVDPVCFYFIFISGLNTRLADIDQKKCVIHSFEFHGINVQCALSPMPVQGKQALQGWAAHHWAQHSMWVVHSRVRAWDQLQAAHRHYRPQDADDKVGMRQ